MKTRKNNAGVNAIRAYQAERHADNVAEYRLISGDRLSAREAAERMGVSERTVTRIRAELRARQAAQ